MHNLFDEETERANKLDILLWRCNSARHQLVCDEDDGSDEVKTSISVRLEMENLRFREMKLIWRSSVRSRVHLEWETVRKICERLGNGTTTTTWNSQRHFAFEEEIFWLFPTIKFHSSLLAFYTCLLFFLSLPSVRFPIQPIHPFHHSVAGAHINPNYIFNFFEWLSDVERFPLLLFIHMT